MVRRPMAEETSAGLCMSELAIGSGAGGGCLQEDGFGVEALAPASKTEQGSEGVAGGEKSDNEDGEDSLADPELGIFCIEAG